MKGPFERLKYDLRRVWECPQCGLKQRTDGTVTTLFCKCKSGSNPPMAMKLVGDGPRRLVPRVAPPPREPETVTVSPVSVAEISVTEITTTIAVEPQETESQEAGPDA
jgi:hypothetical protein